MRTLGALLPSSPLNAPLQVVILAFPALTTSTITMYDFQEVIFLDNRASLFH